MRTKEPRHDKTEAVEALVALVDSAEASILTDYRGLTVHEISTLRTKLRPMGGSYHVVKNTLYRRALGNRLTPELDGLLAGPTAIAFAEADVVAVSKALLDFITATRKPEVVVKGAVLGGKVLSPERVTALSKLPPRNIILGQVVGTLQAPLTNFAGTVNGVLGEFARTLQALADHRQAEAA